MSTCIVTVDIVGSTEIKTRYDHALGVKKINATLTKVRETLCMADESLRCPVPYAGDSILLIGGVQPVEIYRAAVRYQADFRAWPYENLPIKIAIGFGVYESIKGDHDPYPNYHGQDLDLLYAISAWCPPAGIVVTQSMFGVLDEADPRFGRRFYERRERLKGFGERLFFQSNGEYQPPRPKRKPSKWGLLPQSRAEFVLALSIGVSGLIVAVALWFYLSGGAIK